MSNILSRLFSRKKLDPKEPEDHSFTKGNSTEWWVEYYCPHCFAAQDNNRFGMMRLICGQCGYHQNNRLFPNRAYRRIWNGTKWVKQVKYKTGGHNEIQNKETK